jgi:hypothetical protein
MVNMSSRELEHIFAKAASVSIATLRLISKLFSSATICRFFLTSHDTRAVIEPRETSTIIVMIDMSLVRIKPTPFLDGFPL